MHYLSRAHTWKAIIFLLLSTLLPYFINFPGMAQGSLENTKNQLASTSQDMNSIKIPQLFSLGSFNFFFFPIRKTYRFIDQDIPFFLSTLSFKSLWSFILYLLPNRLERQEKSGGKNSWMELLIMIDKELQYVRKKQRLWCSWEACDQLPQFGHSSSIC